VDFPIKIVIFHSCVSLPEGNSMAMNGIPILFYQKKNDFYLMSDGPYGAFSFGGLRWAGGSRARILEAGLLQLSGLVVVACHWQRWRFPKTWVWMIWDALEVSPFQKTSIFSELNGMKMDDGWISKFRNVSTKNIRMGAAQATTHGVGVQEYLKSLSDLKWLESQDHALED